MLPVAENVPVAESYSSAEARGVKLGLPVDVVAAQRFEADSPTQTVEADKVPEGWTIVDVRTPGEHAAGHIPGSINAPVDTLREQLPTLGHGPFVVYCQVGQRGHTATALLHELGIPARNLDGGFLTWQAAFAARRSK